MNVSTEKFSLYQTIDTIAAYHIEYFTIADKHFLAVSSHFNGRTYRLTSVLYQWNGNQFVFFQTFGTNGAAQFNFFRIMQDFFLAVSNFHNDAMHFVNSVIYKWKDNQFETFQEIGTEGAISGTAFSINNDSFIVFANHHNTQKGYSVHSTVYKWSKGHFVKLQSLQTYGGSDVKSSTTMATHSSPLPTTTMEVSSTSIRSFTSGTAACSFCSSPFLLAELSACIHSRCVVKRSWVWPTIVMTVRGSTFSQLCSRPLESNSSNTKKCQPREHMI